MSKEFEKCIAIDGPGGSGKSTIAKIVSEKLGALYVDTGAMFRAIGLVCSTRNIVFKESVELASFLADMKMVYRKSDHLTGVYIEINGENLTDAIREHNVSEMASKISKLPSVRTFLLSFQREIAKNSICVMEGRDIGTVVFPYAFCKIFLTAGVNVRAKRRLLQLQEKGDRSLTYDAILADVKSRDERDMGREIAPLKQADDAYLIDSSDLTLNEVVDKIIDVSKKQAKSLNVEL